MGHSLGKFIRTLQSELYFVKEAKDAFYYHSRRLLARPSDPDFCALRFIPDSLPGCYLDIGANHGQSIAAIQLFKPHARIYSYEANQILSDKLQQRYSGQDTVTVLPYGLADEQQTRILFVPIYKKFVYDGLASFDRESAANWLSQETLYWFSPSKLELKELPATTMRLDDEARDPVFIKIDVQGYEYQVVRGGIETLKRCEPVLMIEDFRGNDHLVRFLQELGYEQYLLGETGFERGDSQNVINTFLMTPYRAGTILPSAAPTE